MAASADFVPAGTRVRDQVTKVGGQPVWRGQPQWPLSKQTGRAMVFLAQFDISDGHTAYVFMTGDDEGWVDGTYDADGGENAVIVQPRGRVPLQLRTIPVAEGPSAGPEYLMIPSDRGAVGAAGETLPPGTRLAAEGASPVWLQGEEWPGPDWRFLAQIDSRDLPSDVNFDFGDMGVGYVFLSADACEGRFLWQCS
ncbi:hypothetical protein BJP40_05470 [Streptomyces sp. CC53]|uniref:hypothetical protein n=1 Tax=Streptomyces sp. CC53 TaxID=1906740 RepID=UPI0008DD70F9|nr:hypothetical protein [Streptomyces sp. CC53]OII61425.1 hypothetical protein BJP40_05470 [Streptomyces sp. CC53]